MERIYFDNAATTPLDKDVADAMYEVMINKFGNPSSIHSYGREARTLIEKARKTVAGLLEVAPGEIFFTSGGTEADNMALCNSVTDLGVERIITSHLEHHAVLHTAEKLQAQEKAEVVFVRNKEDGHIEFDHLEELLKAGNKKTLVTLMHANNEIGNLLDIETAGNLCKEHNAFFHSDTVQTMAHLPVKPKEFKADFIAASAHKFHGPKGTGFIYINSEVQLKPFILGGSQERNMRGGTENIYGIIGLSTALEKAYKDLDGQREHVEGLKQYMIERLKKDIPGVEFNGDPGKGNLFTVLNVAFPPSKVSDMLLFKLDMEGISVSGGSACSSGSNVGSHVLKTVQKDPERTGIRFSFSKFNTKEEVDYTVSKLKEILEEK